MTRSIMAAAILGILWAIPAWADTHTAASCSAAHVQAAINASSNGDTVTVPQGTCTWTTPSAMQPAVKIEGKGLTLQGAGIGQTVITDNTDTPQEYNEAALVVDIALGVSVVITGFTFNLAPAADQHTEGTIKIVGGTRTFRVHHCQFSNGSTGSGNAINISGETWGLIDHCTFLRGASGNFKAFQVSGSDDTSWGQALSLGTANAVYIEDNTFTYSPPSGSESYRILDTARGGRVVFRYNILNNTGDVGSHGYDSDPRAMISMEIYHNTFNHTVAGTFYTAVAFRGGTGVIFDNTFNLSAGGWTNFISLYYYCCCPYDCSHATENIYPGKDQPGFAPTGIAGGQASYPIYEWNNTNPPGTRITTGATCATESTMIQQNRDYFINTQHPTYTAYQYPHPLQGGVSLPAAPTNVRIR